MSLLDNQRAAEGIDGLYMDLEARLMQNIVRHIQNYDQPIPTDEWLLQKLAEIGRLDRENLRIIGEMAGISNTAAQRMLEEMAEKVTAELEPGFQYLSRQGIVGEAVTATKSRNVKQVMKNLRKQAKDTLNLCNTTMLYKARDAYKTLVQRTADLAGEAVNRQGFLDTLNQNVSAAVIGGQSRAQVIRQCIREFNAKGIPAFVDRRGREWTPEAYVNMAMRTTSGSVASQVQMARCEDYGIDLVEVDSHSGARPKCARDQGKIFDRANKSSKYPHWNTSSYGEPDGLLGINCGHHIYPYIEGVSIRRYFPTEDLEENDKLYQQVQVQRGLERAVRKQKRECMLYDELGDKEAFEQAAVKLKGKEAQLKQYVAGNDQLHRRRDREQVVGFDKRISANAVAERKRVAKEASMMYDIGSEYGNIKAYYRDKPLRDKIQSAAMKKELEPGQYRKHVPGSHEYKQYQDKYRRKGQYGPSYLTTDEATTQELVNQYAGTGILTRRADGSWLNEEVITTHSKKIGVAVNNFTGQEADTQVFKIKYGKNGTHVVPDYPSKKGAKAKK